MRAKIVRILSNVEETEKKNKIKYQGKKARPSARKNSIEPRVQCIQGYGSRIAKEKRFPLLKNLGVSSLIKTRCCGLNLPRDVNLLGFSLNMLI